MAKKILIIFGLVNSIIEQSYSIFEETSNNALEFYFGPVKKKNVEE